MSYREKLVTNVLQFFSCAEKTNFYTDAAISKGVKMPTATLDEKTDSPVFALNFRETTVPEKVEGYYDEALDRWIMPETLDPVAYGTNPYDTITTIITGLPGGGSQMDDTSTTDYGDEVVWC